MDRFVDADLDEIASCKGGIYKNMGLFRCRQCISSSPDRLWRDTPQTGDLAALAVGAILRLKLRSGPLLVWP